MAATTFNEHDATMCHPSGTTGLEARTHSDTSKTYLLSRTLLLLFYL